MKKNKLLFVALFIVQILFVVLMPTPTFATKAEINKTDSKKLGNKYVSYFTVTYDGNTYNALCASPTYGTPDDGTSKKDIKDWDLNHASDIKNIVAASGAYNLIGFDWSSYKSYGTSWTMASGAIGYLMNGKYSDKKGFKLGSSWSQCYGFTEGSCSTSYNDLISAINTQASSYSSTLNNCSVKYLPPYYNSDNSDARQALIWLECSSDPPTPTVTSTTLSSISTRSKASVNFTYDGTDTDTITFYHTVSRTANADITSVPYKTCNSSGCSPSDSQTLSGTSSGNLYSHTYTIARGDTSGWNGNTYYIAPGDSQIICEYIRFKPTVYYSDGTSNETVGGTSACATVSRDPKPEPVITYGYEYPTATFAGSVSIAPTTSSNFTCTGSSDGSTCTAKDSVSGSQSFTITYKMRRSDSDKDPSGSRRSYYATGLTEYNKSSGYSLGSHASLSYNANFTNVTTSTESKTITAGAAPQTVCGYLTFESGVNFTTTITYSDGAESGRSTSRGTTYAYDKAAACITVKSPPINEDATFEGPITISPKTTYTYLTKSGNTYTSHRLPSGNRYSFTRLIQLKRTDTNSNTLDTSIKYDYSTSSPPSTRNSTSNSFAIGGSQTPLADEPSVTVSKGGSNQYICGYVNYENVVHYTKTDNTISETGTRGSTTNQKCATIVSPPSDQTQKYKGSTSDTTSDTNLTWNNGKSAYIGKEATKDYILSFNHEISRDTPNNSTNIPNANATNTWYLKSGASSSGTMSKIDGTGEPDTALNSSGKITSSHTKSLSLNSNSSETYCEQLNYKSSITYAYGYLPGDTYYLNGDRTYGSSANTSRVCRKVIRPAYSTFEGRIKIASTWNSNQYSTDDGDEETLTGGGKRKRYGFNIVFEMRRTDTDSMPSSPKSRYKVSYNTDASQPTDASGAAEFTSSDTNWHELPIIADAEAIDVSIGTTTPVNFCAYLTYDTTANYYGSSTPEGRNFDGKKKFCVKITNPSLSYKSTFSASSKVTNPGLHERADGTWEVINYSYNSTTNSYSNANLPKSYTVIFPHTLTRTDTGTPSFKLGDSGDNQSSTRYKIQESLNDAAYSNVSGGTGTKKNFTQSGDNKSQIISAQHSFNFNRSGSGGYNVGSIVKYCQKIVYDKETTYNTIDNPNDVNSYSVNITRSGYDDASVAKCITIRNPNWTEYYSGNINFPITVIGSTILKQNFMNLPEKTRSDGKSPLLTSVMENLTETNNQLYTAKTPTVTAKFEHELHRIVEDFPVETSISVTPGDTIAPYNVPRLQKPTDSVSPSYNVKHKIAGTVKTPNLTGTTVTLAPEAAWNSYTKASGSTTDSFTKTSLLAGQTKQICHKILDGTYNYHINYQKLWRQETYTDTSKNGTAWHFRTDRISSSPVSDGSTDNATEVCVRINRPYNYKVNDVTPSESGHNNGLGYIDDEFQPDFNINVVRDDTNKEYITDMEFANTTLSVFEFVVNKNAASPDGKITNNGTSNSSTDSGICTGYYTFANKKFCRVLESGKQPTSHVGNAVSSSPYSYTTSYTPAKITIPATLTDGTKLEPGDKYCMSIAIKKESSSSSNWFVSKATCVSIAKKPTMQVWGGSILSNGKVKASTSSKLSGSNRSYFGSWTDSALISRDDIKGMASGAGLAGGKTSATKICGYSHLTVSDATCRTNSNATTLGHSTNSRDLTGYYKKIKDKLVPQSIPADGNYNASGTDYEIHFSKNDITISSNIVNNTANAIKQIIYITDKNIYIDQGVTRIDAWLIAKGTINTCSIGGTPQSPYGSGSARLNSDKCTNQLIINGPVHASNLILSRTYGADASKTDGNGSLIDPAERINYTPSTFIWSYNEALKDSSPRTVYLKELSPRY